MASTFLSFFCASRWWFFNYNVHPVICLDISVELTRIETVNIGLAREPQGIIKRDLRCDIEWPFECHAVRYVLLQEGSLVDCIL